MGNRVRLPASQLEARCLEALAEAARKQGCKVVFFGKKGDKPYVETPEENLLPDSREAYECCIRPWLGSGKGQELEPQKNAPPKFCAMRSSSAMVVNAFGPFVFRRNCLTLVDRKGLSVSGFERGLPIAGIDPRYTPPQLDLVASSKTSFVAVEAKLLEPFSGNHTAVFKDRYSRLRQDLWDGGWRDLMKMLIMKPTMFKHLDACQLVKHYLGVRSAILAEGNKHTNRLVYLYWRPKNHKDIQQFTDHEDEIAVMQKAVGKGSVGFTALPLDKVLDNWRAKGTPGWLQRHERVLRSRYFVNI